MTPHGAPRRPRLLDLMAVVAACSLLFAAHRALSVALGDGLAGLALVPTGMLLILAVGLALLAALGRRHDWPGLDESRSFLLVMLLAVGMPTTVFSGISSPSAGILYMAATLAILIFSMHHR